MKQPASLQGLRAAAAAAVLACLGCTAAGKGAPRPGDAAVPPELRSLWERHGGAGAWRGHTAVRFSYRVSAPNWKSEVEIPSVAFRLRDARLIRVELSPGAEPLGLDLEEEGGAAWSEVARFAEDRGADPAGLEFGLRLLPFFFGLPLSASLGPWEFRSVVCPDGTLLPGWLEAVPRSRGAPIGTSFLVADASTGLLAQALYAAFFPEPEPVPRLVTFEDPVDQGGILLARRRTHREVGGEAPAIGEAWAPYAPSPDDGSRPDRDPWELREEVGGIVFLGEEEAEALFAPREPAP